MWNWWDTFFRLLVKYVLSLAWPNWICMFRHYLCSPFAWRSLCGRIEYWLTQAWSLPGMRKVFSCYMCHYLIVFVSYRIGDSFLNCCLTQCAFIHTWRVLKWNTVHFLPPSYHLVLRAGALFNVDWPRNWVDRLTNWLIELFWSSSYPKLTDLRQILGSHSWFRYWVRRTALFDSIWNHL